ncbi:MAG: helix-turn-helix domain-containing protein [Faecousia sp.]
MRNFTDLYRMNLPHRAITVYMYLADRANKDGFCWPSIPTISKDLKLSESTTRRALHDLRKAGLVRTEQRYRENGGNSSLLFLLSVKINANSHASAF